MRPTASRSQAPHLLSSLRRIGSGLLMICLAWSLGTPPLAACVQKQAKAGSKAGVWIGIDGDTVTIKVRDFETFRAARGQSCGCGLEQVDSLSDVSSVQVMSAATGQRVVAFNFEKNANTTAAFSAVDENSPWFGFSGPLTGSVPNGMRVDLVFTGTLTPGADFGSLVADLRNAGDSIGFGEANSDGEMSDPKVCPPDEIDPLPGKSGPPRVQVRRIEMKGSHKVVVTARDNEEGLATVRVIDPVNVSESLPSFTPGRTRTVVAELTMTEGQSLASFGLEACNLRDQCTILRADIASLKLNGDRSASRTFRGIPGTERLIKVTNGEPGVTAFTLTANNRRFSIHPLAAGQTLTLDASLALKEEDNTVSLAIAGEPGGEAMAVMIDLQSTN